MFVTLTGPFYRHRNGVALLTRGAKAFEVQSHGITETASCYAVVFDLSRISARLRELSMVSQGYPISQRLFAIEIWLMMAIGAQRELHLRMRRGPSEKAGFE